MMKAMLSFAFGGLVVFVPQGAKVQEKKPQDVPQKVDAEIEVVDLVDSAVDALKKALEVDESVSLSPPVPSKPGVAVSIPFFMNHPQDWSASVMDLRQRKVMEQQTQIKAELKAQIKKLTERLDRLQMNQAYVKSKSREFNHFLTAQAARRAAEFTAQAEASRARKKARESLAEVQEKDAPSQGKKAIRKLEREIHVMKLKLAQLRSPFRLVVPTLENVPLHGKALNLTVKGLLNRPKALTYLESHFDFEEYPEARKKRAPKASGKSHPANKPRSGWRSGRRTKVGSKAHAAPSVLGVEGKVIWKELQGIRAEIRALRKLLEARSDRRVGRADSPGRSFRVQPGAVVETTDGERFTVPAGMEFFWKDGKLHSRQYAGIKSYSVSLGSVGAPISIPIPKIRAVPLIKRAKKAKKAKKVENKSTGKVIRMEGENIKLWFGTEPKAPSSKKRVQVRRL